MKLTDNFDYLYLKGLLQDKYKDKLFLPDTLVNAIENILLIAEDQENEIEKLKKPRYIYNAKNGEVTKLESNEEIIKLQKENKKLKQLLTYCFEEGVIGK